MSRVEYSAKVGYRGLSGFVSTAYLDERDGDTAWGTNKYTDDPVTLRWEGDGWIEVEGDS